MVFENEYKGNRLYKTNNYGQKNVSTNRLMHKIIKKVWYKSLYGMTSVSYTHLDVYKRQELHSALGGLLVVSAHKPPQTELMSNDLEAVFGAHRRVVLAGDLNCKHPDWGLSLIHI